MTTVPAGNRAEHVPLTAPAESAQAMPAGVDITRPLPVPLPETVSAMEAAGSLNPVGADFFPEQAESAAAATAADRMCRATTS